MSGINIVILARLKPISSLTEDQIVELATNTEELAVLPGKTLFKAGDKDNDLIYLIEGEVVITPQSDAPRTIKSGTPEARHSLGVHNPHRTTAIAKTPVLYIRINNDLVDTMLTWAESADAENEEIIMSGDEILTIDTGALKNKMQRSSNFRKLPAANIERLLETMEPMHYNAGEIIIRQGDEGDYFYVIEQGEALVTRMVDEDEESTEDSVEMAHIGEGSTFGEAALISDKPRNATISMQTDGVLLRLNKESFLKLMQEPMQNWIDYNDSMAKVESGAAWIDVRPPQEFAQGHLNNAINIPMNEAHRQAKSLDENTQYICYCQTGRRSSATAFILSQYGLNVSVLKGGLPAIDGEVPLITSARP